MERLEGQRKENRERIRERRRNRERRNGSRIRDQSSRRNGRGGMDRARGEIKRLERIQARDSLATFPGYDARTARRLERFEIRKSPEAFRRRHRHEGLDSYTRREVERSLRRHRKR